MNLRPSLAILALLTLTACAGASVSDVCAKACACDAKQCGTNETQCVTEGDALQQVAGTAGCTSQFDDLLACGVQGTNACTKSDSACATEQAALQKCAPGLK